MTKTFFQQQETARRKTWLLVMYFVLAVILIICAVYFAAVIALMGGGQQVQIQGMSTKMPIWHPEIFMLVTLITGFIVGLGSIFKIIALRSGGKTIASSLGGRPVHPDSIDTQERRLLNVVEEVAIASGTPVPPVYLLDNENGINAFAAGYAPSDAVIGVTRGCVDLLKRDELQGVIAHEFSHILNGDMRLNIRLMGVLHGILFIGITGYWLLRSTSRGRRRSSSKDGQAAAGIFIFGIALWITGYVGVFFGKLIKAAVSRQREYLADSSAVQFTRQPSGISGALQKIGGLAYGSKLDHSNAEEASHMFFANGITSSFVQLLATHPPLTQRIQAIDPAFDGDYPEVYLPTREELEAQALEESQSSSQPLEVLDKVIINPAKIAQQVGQPGPEHLLFAGQMLASIPQGISTQIHEPFGARVLVYSLLLDQKPEVREAQLTRLSECAEDGIANAVEAHFQKIASLGASYRMPLVDLAMPALKMLSPRQYTQFRENIHYLIDADMECSLFEFTLQYVLLRHLDPYLGEGQVETKSKFSNKEIHNACLDLLGTLAYMGNAGAQERSSAFERGLKTLNPSATLEFDPNKRFNLDVAKRSLHVLSAVAPKSKQIFIEACTACIAQDNFVSIEEAELLRAIGDALDCPIPPFLANQKVEATP